MTIIAVKKTYTKGIYNQRCRKMTNILIVEDERNICEVIKAYLEKEGYLIRKRFT